MILSCTVLAPVALRAQARPPDAAVRAEAERAAKEGERLLAQHSAAQAADQLQHAYTLTHNTKYLLPLGLAYAEAERPLDALDALGHFLKEAPALPDARRKEIGGKLQVMLDQVAAVVTIEASRQNAGVKVDGRPIGTTPIEGPLRLLPGKHEIVLQPAPTDPSSGARAVIDIKPGERRAVKLEPGTRSRFLEPQSRNEEEPPQAEPKRAPVVPVKHVLRDRDEPQSLLVDFNPRTLHRKWWFWTGVGAVTVLAVGLGAGLGTRHGGGAVAQADQASLKAPTWPGGVIDARSVP